MTTKQKKDQLVKFGGDVVYQIAAHPRCNIKGLDSAINERMTARFESDFGRLGDLLRAKDVLTVKVATATVLVR